MSLSAEASLTLTLNSGMKGHLPRLLPHTPACALTAVHTVAPTLGLQHTAVALWCSGAVGRTWFLLWQSSAESPFPGDQAEGSTMLPMEEYGSVQAW